MTEQFLGVRMAQPVIMNFVDPHAAKPSCVPMLRNFLRRYLQPSNLQSNHLPRLGIYDLLQHPLRKEKLHCLRHREPAKGAELAEYGHAGTAALDASCHQQRYWVA